MPRWVMDKKGMSLTPNACAACGSQPRDEETNEVLPAAYASGVDIDWGGTLYICQICAGLLGEMYGMLSQEEGDRLEARVKELTEELEERTTDLETAQSRLDRVLDGKRAATEARPSRRRTTEASS